MKEKIKDSLSSLLGIGFFILIIAGFVLLVAGGAKLFEVLYPVLESISSFVWAIVWLLLFLSIVPRFRSLTGNGIVIGTYVGGAIFWLLCFYITYSLWGFVGILLGVIFMGLGVFFTAVLALLFDGQFGPAFYFGFILAQIYIFRLLGHWIITKYRPKKHNNVAIEYESTTNKNREELDNKILSGKEDVADWLEFDGHITSEANKEIKAQEQELKD